MQCVILAAGKGTRMRPLTDLTPKPLIKVLGKPVLDHILEALPDEITEIILITNYLEDQIKTYYGDEWKGRPIRDVPQENPAGGTGAAILSAKGLITGKFMVLNGDDIHGASALKQAVSESNALITVHSPTPELFGVIEENKDGTLKSIVEKPEQPKSNLINTGGFVADSSLLDCYAEVSELNEVLATDMLTLFAQTHAVKIIEQELWIPVGYPEDIAKAEARLVQK
jgi:bifunctional UDP-N-acetylglucosamine pyrophosphorylase/glucosamine-1-phosphate N-acetyltransferase